MISLSQLELAVSQYIKTNCKLSVAVFSFYVLLNNRAPKLILPSITKHKARFISIWIVMQYLALKTISLHWICIKI